jgi:pimeloyl-ACP methyl ester carboxylesterase
MTRIAISPRFATSTFSNIRGREVIGAFHNERVKRVVAVAGVAALGLAFAAPAEAGPRFKPCGAFGFECARVSVPLDRSGALPGRVSLFVKRIRARERPRRGALVVLAGGPGQSAADAVGNDALALLEPAYRRRDLIVFDQRGTGRSGLLRCRELERANLLRAGAAAGRCAARLGPRRASYTSRDSVEDIEALRVALGYERIALFGTSYGTKVALGYALAHAANVERLVLDSVVEPAGPSPLYLEAFEAVPRALWALCRATCSSFTLNPVADVARLVTRLATRPLRGRAVDSRGRIHRAMAGREDLFLILLAGDLNPALRAGFPGAVRSALDGDPAPLLRLRDRAYSLEATPPSPRVLSAMLYAATTCEETSFPWPRTSPPDPAARRAAAGAAAAALPDSAFLPFDRATAVANDLIDLCGRWPAAPAAPVLAPGPAPDVPLLLIEGEDDLRTPVESARRVAQLFPRSSLVVAPETGHSALGADGTGCTRAAFARFMQGKRFTTRCPGRNGPRIFPPSPPPPTRLGEVAPPRGLRGDRGRVLAAIGLTLRDLYDDFVTELILDPHDPDLARGGGLRSGHYRLDGRGSLRLRDLSFVPGVRLTGRVRSFGMRRERGRLRVEGGRGVPGGVVTIRNRVARGTLGGRPVKARLAAVSVAGVAGARAAQTSSAFPP